MYTEKHSMVIQQTTFNGAYGIKYGLADKVEFTEQQTWMIRCRNDLT